MTTEKKKLSRLTKALLETAEDLHTGGLLRENTYKKITKRHLGEKKKPDLAPLSGEDIRTIREQAHMSQSVFADYLNVTVGYVSKLERGTKQPTGAALVLLDVIRRKGIDAIL
jgi:putative transcriptional regulator